MSERIKIECTVNRILYFNNNWGIINVTVDKVLEGELKTDPEYTVLKGEMFSVKEGESYKASGEYVEDSKYGPQYAIDILTGNITLDTSDIKGQRKFLESIFTKDQVEAMYNALENPYQAFIDEDSVKLCTIKGCGLKTCPLWISRFKENYHRARIYAELEDYNLSASIIDKLLDKYKTPDLVIEKVHENPYILVTEVKGIGWAIADKIAMAGGMSEYDPKRISAFIMYYLKEEGENGFSWITNDQLMGAILERFGNEIPDQPITDAMRLLIDSERLWFSEDKERIGLKRYYIIEHRIAEDLLRLRNAETKFKYDNWEEAVNRIERLQGWKYTEEQRTGIKLALENNVILIQGCAGSGKSSMVWAVLEVLKAYNFVQCALSGKAASRLMEVTGEEGYTIHRLLGYPLGDAEHGGFAFHAECPLGYDIYIVDEVSMIDLNLFAHLIEAIPSGSKLIMLGDNGQLEAIGSGNIAYDLLNSEEIKSVTLTKIHRQAEKSAIITESVKIRNKTQIIEKDWVGHEVRGELQDLDITCFSDQSNTYYKVMTQVQRCWAETHNIKKIQVIVPMKFKGGACTYLLNNAIQELVNPNSKQETQLYATKGMPYVLRVGDKVINTVNNYKTNPNIFNGNIGIIKAFWCNEDTNEENMIIDFDGIGDVFVPKAFWRNIELAYAITCHKCVTGDTYIYTTNGIKQIYELYNGAAEGEAKAYNSNIKVFNGEYFETPSYFYNAGITETKILTTKRGYTLTATYDHGITVLSPDGIFVRKEVKDLSENDSLIIRVGQNLYNNFIDLPNEWYDIKVNARSKIYDLPWKLTEDFAQLLGHMVADGVISNSGFRIAKNQKEVIEEVAILIKNVFGCEVKIQKIIDGPMGGMWQASVSSKYIRAFLMKIDGIQPNNKYVPECILAAPKEMQTRFLRGLFEDGSVSIKKGNFDNISLYQKNIQLLYQVRYMLLNMGIISSLKIYNKTKKNHTIHYQMATIYIYKDEARIFQKEIGFISNNKKEALKLCEINKKNKCSNKYVPLIKPMVIQLLEKNGLHENYFLNRSYYNLKKTDNNITMEMLDRILSGIKEELHQDKDYIILKELVSGKYYFDPIINIQETKAPTYCLTMPESHQFIQNGIMGWNCQGSESDIVIFAFDYSAFPILSKELVYTGLTRAKNKCYLIAQNSALRYSTMKSSVINKQTHLREQLHDIAHPKIIF